ncbi:MAG: tRNA pseudouridine(38-40) synthase TruA [Flavobacteriaceae bacterium]
MRYFINLSYLGTPFHGWQYQPNAISVQEVLEEALTRVLRSPIKVTGAGRTDTGVHARLMVAHFDAEIPPKTFENLVYLLNQYLKSEVVILSIFPVIGTAHARFDATLRTYEYHIVSKKDPFTNGLAYFFREPLDIPLMNKASQLLMTFKDFQAFSKTNTDVKTFLCDISSASWGTKRDGYVFTITANRFLRNMVRAIVGTLLDVGVHKITIEELKNIINSKERSKAGFSVPAHGLYLTDIQYPKNIMIDNG